MEYDSNCTQAFTDADKRHTLLAMGSVGASAAVVCFMAVILVLYFKLFKYFAHRLALYQVLAALGLAIALACQMVFITNPENEKGPACETISFFFVYFSWVKLMFISWVVLHLFCFSVFYKNLQNFEILFVCVYRSCSPFSFYGHLSYQGRSTGVCLFMGQPEHGAG